jgi:hypothetical protein
VASGSSARIGVVRGIVRFDTKGQSWVRINDGRHWYAWTGSAITGDSGASIDGVHPSTTVERSHGTCTDGSHPGPL